MIGERVESYPRGSVWAIVFLVLGIALGALLLLAPKKDAWPIAFLPLGIAAGIWLGRESRVVFRVESRGLEFEEPHPFPLDYDAIRWVSAHVKRGPFPMTLHHTGGTTILPSKLSVTSNDLYEFLITSAPPPDTSAVPKSLVSFRDEQIAKFGEERVFSFVGGPPNIEPRSYRGIGAMIGFSLAAIPMGIAGHSFVDSKAGWIEGSTGAFFFGLFIALILFFARMASSSQKSNPSGLVIAPTGLALAQDDIQGKLRWDEVQAIEHPPVKRMGTAQTANSRHGIGIQVEGAYIVIKDRYHRPAREISQCLKSYWNNGRPG